MHVTLGIYSNKEYVYNVVRDEDLESHISYNKTFRPGRVFYVDGERVNNGMMKEEYLGVYDEIAKNFFEEDGVNKHIATIPYR